MARRLFGSECALLTSAIMGYLVSEPVFEGFSANKETADSSGWPSPTRTSRPCSLRSSKRRRSTRRATAPEVRTGIGSRWSCCSPGVALRKRIGRTAAISAQPARIRLSAVSGKPREHRLEARCSIELRQPKAVPSSPGYRIRVYHGLTTRFPEIHAREITSAPPWLAPVRRTTHFGHSGRRANPRLQFGEALRRRQ